MDLTAKEKILRCLESSVRPLAVHELDIQGVSECSASARLREMKRDGIVLSIPVPGKKYTAWLLSAKDMTLI